MNRHDTLLLAMGNSDERGMLRDLFSEHYNLLETASAVQTKLILEQNMDCIAAVILIAGEEDFSAEDVATFQDARNLFERLPVIVISTEDSQTRFSTFLRNGAADVLYIHHEPFALLRRVEAAVELNLYKMHLESMVDEQASLLRHSNDAIVDALSSIIEYRSAESGQHILRIRHFTKLLLEDLMRCCPEYKLTDEKINIISSAAALHDVGKIVIPDAILNKPGKLTPEERLIMQDHTVRGCDVLQRLGNTADQEYLRYAYNICRYHHERWDGGGYPDGLRGEDIPICAQAVGLADVYDALTTKRIYKDAYPIRTAVNMILNGECGTFSPRVLECFKHVTKQFAELVDAYADGLDPQNEVFDTTLPKVELPLDDNSLNRIHAKYLALVHYSNAFLLELDYGNGLFHIIYNPYPEFMSLNSVNTLPELKSIILDSIVVPEQRERMKIFLHEDLPRFMHAGMRRTGTRFHLQNHQGRQNSEFDVTLIRINPTETTRQSCAVLCRMVDAAEASYSPPISSTSDALIPLKNAYRCRHDDGFTLLELYGKTLAGYTAQEIQEQFDGKLLELVVPEDRSKLQKDFAALAAAGTFLRMEYRIRHKNGKILWVLDQSRLYRGAHDEQIITYLTDVSDIRRPYEDLHKKLERYEIILAQTENVLFEWDILSDSISFSDTWETLFGFVPISGKVREALVKGSYFHPDDIPLLTDRISSLEKGSSYEMLEVRIATIRGRYIWCRFRASAIRAEDGHLEKIVGILINVDSEKQAERALQDKAERDALTKMLNKHAGKKLADEYFSQYGSDVKCAMLIIDLDDFKSINDRFGHLFGDSVLAAVSREIRRQFRNQDIFIRIGGDEFLILMRGVCDRKLVEQRCGRLLSVLRSIVSDQYQKLPVSCSIGIALAPEHGTSYIELFQRADQALYQAKAIGKNQFVFYTPEIATLTNTQLDTVINNKIDSDELPGMANDNIVRHAFQRLYSSDDVSAAVNSILDLIGRQLNVSRVYIFENTPDNRYCNNTYEWCNEGILPQIDNLQYISYETDIPNYEDNFNEQGIFYCPDINVLPPHVYDIVAPQGIKSMLHCAIRENGVFRGYIGFDECTTTRIWTNDQIQLLTYFSEMLSVFLLKKQKQDLALRHAEEMSSILDNQNAWIYIIDPDTCELKYLNAKTRELAPEAKLGMRCYEALMGQCERCDGCPSLNIRKKITDYSYLNNDKFDLQVLAEATLIQWSGEESCLLTCREIPNIVKQDIITEHSEKPCENRKM